MSEPLSEDPVLAKPTPGPWIADDLFMEDYNVLRVGTFDGTTNYYHNSQTVCECWYNDEPETGKPFIHLLQAQANARLIAAAPELLAALQRMLDPTLRTEDFTAVREQARAAIAKAQGCK